MRWLQRVWESITEPRHMKVAYLAIYLLTIMIGYVTLTYPPQSIAGEIGPVLTVIWSVLFIVGGAAGTITVLPGWWWAERLLAIAPIGMGLAIYLLVAIILHAQNMDTGSSRLTQVGIIVLAASPFIIRMLIIRDYSYEPRRRG
ncbi:hypothetical protein [Microbacterium sp. YY-01]|uniref:hypothetical protein n=1 Tax=Microbacterium sp. YY-01 TaxID=3421634 RepID=UPI003D1643E1